MMMRLNLLTPSSDLLKSRVLLHVDGFTGVFEATSNFEEELGTD